MSRTKRIVALIGNLLTAVFSLVGTVIHLSRVGWSILEFYTVDSNILVFFSSLICAYFLVGMLRGRRGETPRWAVIFKYFTVCLVAVTFFVVLLVLAPMFEPFGSGYLRMFFFRQLLFHHLLAPVCAMVTFIFFDERLGKGIRYPFFSLFPTIAYAVVTVILNLTRVLHGPYPFLYVYEQPVYMSVLWFFIIVGFALFISFGVYLAQRGRRKRPVTEPATV